MCKIFFLKKKKEKDCFENDRLVVYIAYTKKMKSYRSNTLTHFRNEVTNHKVV